MSNYRNRMSKVELEKLMIKNIKKIVKQWDDDGIIFEDKMEEITIQLAKQFEESKKLEDKIRKALGGIGYEI